MLSWERTGWESARGSCTGGSMLLMGGRPAEAWRASKEPRLAAGGEPTEMPTPEAAERGGRSPRPSAGCCGGPLLASPGGGMTPPLSVCQVLLLYGPFTEACPELRRTRTGFQPACAACAARNACAGRRAVGCAGRSAHLADCSASDWGPPEPATLPQEDGEYAVPPPDEAAASDSRCCPWEPGAAATG